MNMDGLGRRWIGLIVVVLAMSGCATPLSMRPYGAVPNEAGPTVAAHLQDRFDETMTDCGSATRPAFLCSGILLRSTIYSAGYHSWIPNPTSAPYGVSVSWLRQDSNFDDNYPSANGFIVYPRFYADDGNYDLLTVRCAYPSDASTGGPDRCRTPCQAQGVTTAAQWIARFKLNTTSQCAFDVMQGTPRTADAWMQMVAVRKTYAFFDHNEIIFAAWAQNTMGRMPVEAFFIRTNNGNGLPSAQADQKDFRTAAGRWVPIIRWTPSTTVGGRATFTYNVADQAILQ